MIAIDLQKANIVRSIYQQYLSGMSLGRIADFLFEQQILSPKGKGRWTQPVLSNILSELSSQLQDSSFNEPGSEDRLGLLVTAEWNRRQTNTVAGLIRNAHFAAPFAAVEEIAYYEDRKLDKAQMPSFSTCKFVDEGHHIILKGASGNGKTYIACALGNAACRWLKKVRYARMPELLDELSIARSAGELKKCLAWTCWSWVSGLSGHSRPRSPTICWKSWRPAANAP